jgi:hypothetical protein
VLVSAALREISVERIEAHERRTMFSVQLSAGGDQAAAKAISEFRVQDGDQVLVSSILPYNEASTPIARA